MSTYATGTQLKARLSNAYEAPEHPEKILARASELIDYATHGRAETIWGGADGPTKTAVTNATCDQVEYWLEVGEERDVIGLKGSIAAGRLQIGELPPILGMRALRTLIAAGLIWTGAPAYGGVPFPKL